MKKIMVTMSCLSALTGMSQQKQEQQQLGNLFSDVGLSNKSYVQRQSNPALYASNKISNQAKVTQTYKATRRAPVQQNVVGNVNRQVQLVRNDDVQQVQIQVMNNNVGNELNFIQQIASAEIPAIQVGNGNMELNPDIAILKVNLNLGKYVAKSRATSSSSKYKMFQLDRKLKKMNRKLSAKFSVNKKLKIKVDNC